MNKINGHKATLHIAEKAAVPPAQLLGKSMRVPNRKGPLPPFVKKYAGDPPLCAARGDDDLMSEEPWVNERG